LHPVGAGHDNQRKQVILAHAPAGLRRHRPPRSPGIPLMDHHPSSKRSVANHLQMRSCPLTARSQFGQLKSDVCRRCSTQAISFPRIRQAKEASSITTLAEPHKLRPCYPWKMTTAVPGSRAARSGDDINQIERYGAITVGSVGDEDGLY